MKLQSKRIYLIHGSNLSKKEQGYLIYSIVKGNNSAHQQFLDIKDAEVILNNYEFIYLIKKRIDRSPIGYISTSDDFYFEIYVDKKVRGTGYTVEASLLFISYFFSLNLSSSVYTLIKSENRLSRKSAMHFGWEIMNENSNNDWSSFELTKDHFYGIKLLKKLRVRYKIF